MTQQLYKGKDQMARDMVSLIEELVLTIRQLPKLEGLNVSVGVNLAKVFAPSGMYGYTQFTLRRLVLPLVLCTLM